MKFLKLPLFLCGAVLYVLPSIGKASVFGDISGGFERVAASMAHSITASFTPSSEDNYYKNYIRLENNKPIANTGKTITLRATVYKDKATSWCDVIVRNPEGETIALGVPEDFIAIHGYEPFRQAFQEAKNKKELSTTKTRTPPRSISAQEKIDTFLLGAFFKGYKIETRYSPVLIQGTEKVLFATILNSDAAAKKRIVFYNRLTKKSIAIECPHDVFQFIEWPQLIQIYHNAKQRKNGSIAAVKSLSRDAQTAFFKAYNQRKHLTQ